MGEKDSSELMIVPCRGVKGSGAAAQLTMHMGVEDADDVSHSLVPLGDSVHC